MIVREDHKGGDEIQSPFTTENLMGVSVTEREKKEFWSQESSLELPARERERHRDREREREREMRQEEMKDGSR